MYQTANVGFCKIEISKNKDRSSVMFKGQSSMRIQSGSSAIFRESIFLKEIF